MNNGIQVSSGARLHLGLVDLTGATGRLFGGIGCVLEEPRTVVIAEPDHHTSVRVSPPDSRLTDQIQRALSIYFDVFPFRACKITVKTPPRHSGFGTGTSAILCTLAAVCLVSGTNPEDQKDLLSQASGRGGASGVGIHGFFKGGWIVDLGRPHHAPVLPSSYQIADEISLLLAALPPTTLDVDLYLPRDQPLTKATEQGLFEQAQTGDPGESQMALASLYHGILPALFENDIGEFGKHLRRYQSVGLKKLEIHERGELAARLLQRLDAQYAAFGMSSFGPLMFGLRPSDSVCPSADITLSWPSPLDSWRTHVASSGWRIDG